MGKPDLLQTIGLGVENMRVANLGSGKCDNAISVQVRCIPCLSVTNVDIFYPYLHYLQTQPFAARLVEYVHSDILTWIPKQEKRAYDVILFLDVLEHLEFTAGQKALKQCKRMATRKVIVFGPLGDCPQEEYEGNMYQRHLSMVTVQRLEKLGFKVQVLSGFHEQFSPPRDACWAVLDI
jgi:hypothetical protein